MTKIHPLLKLCHKQEPWLDGRAYIGLGLVGAYSSEPDENGSHQITEIEATLLVDGVAVASSYNDTIEKALDSLHMRLNGLFGIREPKE